MENRNQRGYKHIPPHRIEEVLTDSHAHISFPQFNEDRFEVVKRAREKGVKYILEVGCGGKELRKMAEKISSTYEEVYFSVGIHPHDAEREGELNEDEISLLLKNEKFVALGETGLDFVKSCSSRESQRKTFEKTIELSKKFNLPLIIHTRGAMDEAIDIISKSDLHSGGVFHCFSGNYEQAKIILNLGFFISVPCTITYKNSSLKEIVQKIPVEALLIETDSPYLPPQHARGKRNEPSNVFYVAEEISRIKNLSLDDVKRVTNLNFHRAFRIPFEPEPKIAYRIRNSLYLNITNRCTNSCTFCGKKRSWFVKGHYLKLEREPDVEEIISSIDDPSNYDEIVFCGYGEPLLRLDVVKKVCEDLRKKSARKIRIDTDGLANTVHKIDVPKFLKGFVDVYSVSLNAHDEESYAKLCRPPQGIKGFADVLDFIKSAVKHAEVIVTIVDIPGAVDKEKVEKICHDLKVHLRVRVYNDLG